MITEGEYTVTIHLIHGEPIKFKITPTEAEMLAKRDDIEAALNRVTMGLEIDGKFLMIPYSNIKYIEADPAPLDLPIFVLQNAISID